MGTKPRTMPLERKRPSIIHSGKTMPFEDFMAKLEEGAKFEKTTDVLVEDFHKLLLEKGLTPKEADRIKDDCTSFIGICVIKYNIKSLGDITKAMLTRHLEAMEKAIGNIYTKKIYVGEQADILKQFFTYLHQEKNITNKKVLGVFYSKQELKEWGIK